MADDFYDDQDPFFMVEDKLDAGEKPASVHAWAKKQRARCKDRVMRDQWDEALRYIEEEYPEK